MSNMKYPNDIYTLVRKSTLSIEGHFVPKTADSPMKIFEESFSLYKMTVIEERQAAWMNIKLSMLPGIRAKTDLAARMQFEPRAVASAASGQNSPGFTKQFAMGNLKGKTPVQVLLENPENGKKLLRDQYIWLKQNLAKYPKNQEMMDAISDASNADLSGMDTGTAGVEQSMVLLDIGCRPLVRKQRADGKNFVYEGTVKYVPGQNYPVEVTVSNYWAPVIKRENGMLNVQTSAKADEIKRTFRMTMEEWLDAVYTMEACRDDFRTVNFARAYKQAEEAARENRLNAAQAQAQAQA